MVHIFSDYFDKFRQSRFGRKFLDILYETAVLVAYIGAIDDNTEDASAVTHKYVEDAVNSLLKGQQVPVTETKAVGCTIKWRS